jgi:CheY-like chemotaxis protein
MRILLADDDAIYRQSLRNALEHWGYEVVAASEMYQLPPPVHPGIRSE